MLRRLSHHVAWSRKGRRPAQAAQALAASSVRQGPVRGRTWTPHGAVQSQTSSRTTRRQGTERRPASARCCLRTYAHSSSPKTSISAHTGNMLVQNTLTRRGTASGNGVRSAGELTSQLRAPPHSCLQNCCPRKEKTRGQSRWPEAQGGDHLCKQDVGRVLKPQKPREIIKIASGSREWGSRLPPAKML